MRRVGRLLVALPFAALFASAAHRSGQGRPPRRIRFVPDFRDGFAFGGEAVARLSDDGRVTVFSTACTHLGCRISRVEDGLLVCPCHGSRFAHDGSVASGPATRPLATRPFTTDPATGALVVDVG